MLKFLFMFNFFLFSVTANDEVTEFFQEHYFSCYTSGKCGLNSLAFLQELDKRDQATGFYLVKIKNKGFSAFGMVNAEQARAKRFNKLAAAEKNWYFHALVVGPGGLVYDSDFTAAPTVVDFKTYVDQMFLIETECGKQKYGEICVGADRKLDEYELEWVAAMDLLADEQNATFIGSLRESLEFVSTFNK